jgi:hypothetical protein
VLVVVVLMLWIVRVNPQIGKRGVSSSPSVPQVNLSSSVPVHETTNGDNDKNSVAQQSAATPTSVSVTTTLGLELVRAGQVGSDVQIRANITGASSGTCTATFTQGGYSFTVSNPITFDVSRGICGAFNVSASSFSADGTWQMLLKAQRDQAVSNIVSQAVTVSRELR